MRGLPEIVNGHNTTREQRVFDVQCLLKNTARAALSAKGRSHSSPIVDSFFHESGFLHDPSSRAVLYEEGVRSVWSVSNETDFKSCLAGGAFAEIASHFLVARESKTRNTFIDAPTTFAVMQKLYPDAEVIDHPYGPSLEGISVPDGLVVSPSGRIVSVVEVKSSLYPKRVRNLKIQMRWERNHIKNDYPELTTEKGPTLLLVTPQLDPREIPDFIKSELAREDPKIEHMMLPLNKRELAEIVVDMFGNYRPRANVRERIRAMDPEDQFGPTLAELWQEKQYQENRSGIVEGDLAVALQYPIDGELLSNGIIFDEDQLTDVG